MYLDQEVPFRDFMVYVVFKLLVRYNFKKQNKSFLFNLINNSITEVDSNTYVREFRLK